MEIYLLDTSPHKISIRTNGVNFNRLATYNQIFHI